MSKYATGRYLVIGFNRVGGKVFANSYWCCFTEAQEIGREAVGRAEAHSFVVARVLFNSLDPNANFGRPTGRYSDGKPYEEIK